MQFHGIVNNIKSTYSNYIRVLYLFQHRPQPQRGCVLYKAGKCLKSLKLIEMILRCEVPDRCLMHTRHGIFILYILTPSHIYLKAYLIHLTLSSVGQTFPLKILAGEYSPTFLIRCAPKQSQFADYPIERWDILLKCLMRF